MDHTSRQQDLGLAYPMSTTGRIAHQRSFLLGEDATKQKDYSGGVDNLDTCVEISRRGRAELLSAVDQENDEQKMRSSYRSVDGKLFLLFFRNS